VPGHHEPSAEASPSESVSTLAANLRRLRAEAGWSTRELAEHAGLVQSTLYRIEHGHHATVRLSTVLQLAKALGVHVAVLLTPGGHSRQAWAQDQALNAAAANIVRRRKAKGWTQEALGEQAQVPRHILAKIERQNRNPTLDVLDRLAAALEVTAADLLTPPPN